MFFLMLLGILSGLPLPLTASTLTFWLAEHQVSKAQIGLLALVALPYAGKFLWAPFLDIYAPPVLKRFFKAKLDWAAFCQIALALCLFALSRTDPSLELGLVGWIALGVAFFSASQDIALDGYRVALLKAEDQGTGVAIFTFGYRIGMLIGGAGALYLAAFSSWMMVFQVAALIFLSGLIVSFFAPKLTTKPKAKQHHIKELWGPFRDILARDSIGWIIVFIISFKLCDALSGAVMSPFYLDMGFTKIEIANITKLFGFFATIAGSFWGGYLVQKFGFYRSLLWGAGLQVISVAVFVGQSLLGHHLYALTFSIGFENLASGMGSTAFVAFLSSLCRREFSASQYALLSALAVFGRTLLSSSSGLLAESMGWPIFFAFSAAMGLPAVLMVFYLRKKKIF